MNHSTTRNDIKVNANIISRGNTFQLSNTVAICIPFSYYTAGGDYNYFSAFVIYRVPHGPDLHQFHSPFALLLSNKPENKTYYRDANRKYDDTEYPLDYRLF